MLRSNFLEKTQLTIIRKTAPLSNYPFRALSPEVVALMEGAAKDFPSIPSAIPLKLFECYCDLMGVNVSYITLSSPSYFELARGFLGALRSTSLIDNDPTSRQSFVRLFTGIHNVIRAQIPAMEELRADPESMRANVVLWDEYRSKLNEESLRYWNGWGVTSPKGREYFLNLPCLWLSHGKDFTEDFYNHWVLFFKKQARCSGQLIPDTTLSFSSACAGANPSLN